MGGLLYYTAGVCTRRWKSKRWSLASLSQIPVRCWVCQRAAFLSISGLLMLRAQRGANWVHWDGITRLNELKGDHWGLEQDRMGWLEWWSLHRDWQTKLCSANNFTHPFARSHASRSRQGSNWGKWTWTWVVYKEVSKLNRELNELSEFLLL